MTHPSKSAQRTLLRSFAFIAPILFGGMLVRADPPPNPLVVTCSTGGYSTTVLNDGPIAYWRFGESTGATQAADATGHGHTVNLPAVTLGVTPGAIGASTPGLSVTNGYARLASEINASSGPVSFEWWIRPTAQGGDGYGTLLQDNDAFSNTFSNGIFLLDAAPGTVMLSMWHDNSDHLNNTPLNTGTLYHVVASVDGSGNGTWYVNGVADGTFTYTGLKINQLFTDYAGEALQASLVDEIAIYPSQLTQTDAATHFGLAGNPSGYASAVLAGSPLAYWNLDETTGTTLADSSSNGHTAKLASIGFGAAPGGSTNFGPAYSLTSGYGRLANSIDLSSGAASFEWWINPQTQGGDGYGALIQDNDAISATFSDGFFLVDSGPGAVMLSMWHDNGDHFNNTPLNTGTLYHVVASIDGSGNGTWYVNGVADGTFTFTGLKVDQLFTDYAAEDLQASIFDEVAIYQTQLSAGTVANHFTAGTQPVPSSTVTYGDAAPAFVPTYAGFVNGDTSSVVSPPAVCSTSYAPGSPVSGSPYVDSASTSGAAAPGYSLSYVDGAITVVKANPTCTITGYTVLFDGSSHTATGSCKGVFNETLSGLVLTSTTHTAAGDYPSDAWTFTDVTGNYNNQSGTVHDIITGPIVSTNDAYTWYKNVTMPLAAPGVLSNDTDPNAGATMSVAKVNGSTANVGVSTATTHGQITLNADGSFSYVPAVGFKGTDTFTYVATDTGGAAGNTATVTFTIGDLKAIATSADSYAVIKNLTLTVAAADGVLVDDTDPNTSALPMSVSKVNGSAANVGVSLATAHGQVTVSADGSFVYVPVNNFTGNDSFTYNATDTAGATSNQSTVTIAVKNVANMSAGNDSYSAIKNATLTVAAVDGVLADDTDPNPNATSMTVSQVNGSAANIGVSVATGHGHVTVNADGSFSYTPNTNFTGNDTFTYKITDNYGAGSNQATVTIATANPAAIAGTADSYATAKNTVLNVPAAGVLTNDTDPNLGGTMSVAKVMGSTANVGVAVATSKGGSVTLNADGSFTFTPKTNFGGPGPAGQDTFTYTITDQYGATSNTVTVTIQVG